MVEIKDMEMPKNCLDCPISHKDKIDYYICGKTGKNVYLYANEIHPACPLIEIITCEYEASKYDLSDSYESYVAGQEGECAEQHRQLTEWLNDYKRLKEQEPILDKIYADIQKLRSCSCYCSDGIIDDVEDIIDAYKAEMEGKK